MNPYTFEDVVAAMNEVQPYDWRGFFTERVTRVQPRAPLAGITRGGWRVTYSDSATAYHKSLETARKRLDFKYSVGLYLTDEGQAAYLEQALRALRAQPGIVVVNVSSYHETAPVGGPSSAQRPLPNPAASRSEPMPSAELSLRGGTCGPRRTD